jgi:hypothetical protein
VRSRPRPFPLCAQYTRFACDGEPRRGVSLAIPPPRFLVDARRRPAQSHCPHCARSVVMVVTATTSFTRVSSFWGRAEGDEGICSPGRCPNAKDPNNLHRCPILAVDPQALVDSQQPGEESPDARSHKSVAWCWARYWADRSTEVGLTAGKSGPGRYGCIPSFSFFIHIPLLFSLAECPCVATVIYNTSILR